jgi:hypothetical protein
VAELLAMQDRIGEPHRRNEIGLGMRHHPKMFRTTGILSKDARTSPLVAAGSIRGSLAIRLFLTLLFLLAAAEPSAPG